VEKAVDENTVIDGAEISYTINYGNNGQNIAEDVVLTETYPSAFTFG
jgi:uncharacterized repeat protein (TIGR01451 family)